MILKRLTLTDFGVFHSRHTIDLTPKKSRPIVLFGGKNGAGKSTILEAIRLCFYGAGALAFKSKDEYCAYLNRRIHTNPNALIQPQFASVDIEFEYGDIDALRTYRVTRSWERRGSKIAESLSLFRDGKPLDEIAAEHWQDFVRDLIPMGISQLFFFDGERIQELAEDDTGQESLSLAIKAFLGLDIVERLQTDLSMYVTRFGKPTSKSKLSPTIKRLEQEMCSLKTALAENRDRRIAQENRIIEMRAQIAQVEAKIASEGGGFARNREGLLQKQASLQTQIRAREDSIRELCSGLLPFAVIPELCSQLEQQVLFEERCTRQAVINEVVSVARERMLNALQSESFWFDESNSLLTDKRDELQKKFAKLVESELEAPAPARSAVIHCLSDAERKQILSWIDQATRNVPPMMHDDVTELERCYRELHSVEASLRRIPADALLAPLVQSLHELHHTLAQLSSEALLTEERIKTLETSAAQKDQEYRAVAEKLAAEAAHGTRMRLLPSIQKVLDEYKEALLQKKVAQLQEAVTDCFQRLCRKKDSLTRIHIDPRTFSIQLRDREERPLSKSQLSAGEKQIYAISMLWGLARTSGKPLPLIIDTPLARLDSDHRALLAQHYFPFASHQVLILSTDTEVDKAYFDLLKPAVSRLYRLDFDFNLGGTVVESGYFWGSTANEANESKTHNRSLEQVAISGR